MNKGVKKFIIPVALVLLGFGCAPEVYDRVPDQGEVVFEDITAPTAAHREDVIAAWIVAQGSDFESIILDGGGEYFTYLHERPYDAGTWEWFDEVGQLTLTSTAGETFSHTFKHIEAADNTLYLEDENGKDHVWWLIDVDHE